MVLSAVCCGNEIECNTQWWMICITHFVGWDMVVLYLLKLHRQCTVCTHSAHDTSLRVSYISLYSVYSFSILSAHLCIMSLHISVHSHLCIFDTINFHTPCMLICVYCRTGNNAAPQSVGLLHGPHRLQPHATGNKHGCRARVRRVWPETETPIGTFGGQCPLPAMQLNAMGDLYVILVFASDWIAS